MNENYFVLEYDGNCIDDIVIIDNDTGSIKFKETMSMSYEEIKSYERLDEFLDCLMDANEAYFGTDEKHVILNLVNHEDTLIWGILCGVDPDDKELIRYCFIDWGKDGKTYKYEKN